MSVMIEGSAARQSKSLRREQLEKLSELRQQALVPMADDSPETKKLIDEVHREMGNAADPSVCQSKLPGWRRRVRVSRYDDWMARRR